MNNWSGKVFIKTKDEEDARYEDVFTTYGICLLKGSYEKLLEYPTPKSLITWSDRRNNGVEYLADGDTIRVDKKSVVINVVLLAKDEKDYYTKYEAFFKRLTSGIIYLHSARFLNLFIANRAILPNLTRNQVHLH